MSRKRDFLKDFFSGYKKLYKGMSPCVKMIKITKKNYCNVTSYHRLKTIFTKKGKKEKLLFTQ